MLSLRRKEAQVFEDIEKANDREPVAVIAQNHPDVFVSFVWDNTRDSTGD